MTKLYLDDDLFGPLLPFVKDNKVRDISWNGKSLWVDRKEIKNSDVTNTFVKQLLANISSLVNIPFSQQEPMFSTETDTLRISAVHPSVTNTGPCLAIRKYGRKFV